MSDLTITRAPAVKGPPVPKKPPRTAKDDAGTASVVVEQPPAVLGAIGSDVIGESRRRTLVIVLAGLAGVVAALALAGWIFNLGLLTRVIPGTVGMEANTAVALLLLTAGIALGERQGLSRAFAGAAAAAAALVAGLSLLEYAVGNLGIDQLLFRDPTPINGASPAGRIVALTAIAILVLVAGVAIRLRGRTSAGQWTAVLAGMIALTAVIGYGFGDSGFYGPVAHSSMAFTTALSIFLASMAVVIGAEGRVSRFLVSDDPTTVIARRLLAGMVLLLAVIALLAAYEVQAGSLPASSAVALICLIMVITMTTAVVEGSATVRGMEIERLAERQSAAERESALQAATERAREFEVLSRLSVATAGLADENELADLAETAAMELVRADGALIRWYDPATDQLRQLGGNRRRGLGAESIPARGSAMGAAVMSRAMLVVNDYDTSARIDDGVRLRGVKAMLAIPLIVDGAALGALGVVSFGDRRFDLAEATTLSMLGLQVGSAIAAARLHSSLLGSEEKFRGVFDDSGIGMILIGHARTILRVNEATCRMLGLPAPALVGKRLRDFADPAGLVALDPAIVRIRAGDLPHHQAELCLLKPDGASVWARLHLSGMRDVEQGGRRSVLVQIEDVTSAKEAEEAVRAAEERNAAVIETALDGIVVIDDSDRIMEFNPAAALIFGIPRAQALGRDVVEVVASEQARPQVREALHRYRRSDIVLPSRAETVGERADGSQIPLEISLARIDAAGSLYLAASIRDLSDRDRLAQSRELLGDVLSSAPVLLFALDLDGTITLAEGSLATRTVPNSAALVGLNLRKGLQREPTALAHLERALAGETFSGQVDLTSIGLWLDMSYAPIVDSLGSMTGSSGVAVDVSDRVRAAAAQSDSEAKTRLVATVNHEVRTPLSAVLGFTELLITERAGPLTEKQRRYLGNIDAAGHHLLELISDSLDLSKIEAGKMDLQPSVLDVRPFLERAVEQAAPIAIKKNISLTVEAGAHILVLADHRRLLQVVWNLLSNAIRHTPDNGRITVSGIPFDDHVEIAVRDTGIGIPEDQLERIFEEYSQVGKRKDGTGLGLPVSRKLAQLMNGDLRVSSHLGVGSTFTVTLPAGSIAAEPTAENSATL